jgi:hypothetical protein
VPVKQIRFTSPDGREITNALEAKARLEGITIHELVESLLRDALRRDTRIHPGGKPSPPETEPPTPCATDQARPPASQPSHTAPDSATSRLGG